jgi:hypothetical protein
MFSSICDRPLLRAVRQQAIDGGPFQPLGLYLENFFARLTDGFGFVVTKRTGALWTL